MSESTFREFYLQVEHELEKLGYTKSFVKCFYHDIVEYWEKNKSVDEVVDYIA